MDKFLQACFLHPFHLVVFVFEIVVLVCLKHCCVLLFRVCYGPQGPLNLFPVKEFFAADTVSSKKLFTDRLGHPEA